jgi:hypothetical protein
MKKQSKKKLMDEWKKAVELRMGNKCIICGKKPVNYHHLVSSFLLDFRYDDGVGVPLCPLHHRFSKTLSPHNGPLGFFYWFFNKFPEKTKYIINKLNKD